MTNTLSDLDQINAELMGQGARNPFGRAIEPGTAVSGEIIAVVRRQRHNSAGEPLFWKDRRPQPAANGTPVIDSQLIIETGVYDDDADDGLRAVTLDRDVQRAISAAVRRSRAGGIAIGGRLDNLVFVGPAENGSGRAYKLDAYVAPAAE
ncbi:hypothetical protein [Nocardia sp. NPDC057353]|uniref:hypothetical protein n=1 Tax=Nocardia sp. NPDC057353 TaxID=3346104 RepID=UPI00363055F6